MEALAPETPIAPAPLPGLARIFHAADLRRLAAIYGLPAPPDHDLCVVRPVAPLDPEQLLEAMRREWPAARIELVDFSRHPAPQGPIHFPRSGLHASAVAAPGGALWSGWVQYAENLRFSVWARVRITVPVELVVAAVDLAPGKLIEPEQVRLVRGDGAPSPSPIVAEATALDQVIGKCPRQTIRAGQTLRCAWLEEPKAVLRGDTVKVVVRSGGAQLEFEGLAEASAAVGETVFVRNPDNQRRFAARVEAKGQVSVKP